MTERWQRCWTTEPSALGQYYPARAKYLDPGGARRVMIAHGSDRLRHVHASSLHREGHVVLATSDGDEALTVLSSVGSGALPVPDVVVLDLVLPADAGIRLVEAMRRESWAMPIVVVSNRLDRRLRAIMAGFDVFACLTKPVSATLLGRAVEDALADEDPR